MTREMHLLLFLLALIGTAAVLAGCTGSAGPQAPVSPPLPVTDLTNQNSPEAAAFTGSSSRTTLHEPAVPLGLRSIARGFASPMAVSSPRDGTGRLFLVGQGGQVRIFFMNGTVLPAPFMDISDRMVTLSPRYDERGLYSLAFHPDYASNGRVFVYYSAPLRAGAPAGWSCTNRLSEFTVSATDPGRVNHSSERVLLEVDKPAQNHNGGVLLFGPDDGFLYLTLGDGGGADDTGTGHTPGSGNARDMTKLHGKVIRIDPDTAGNGRQYGIPANNPFVSNSSVPPEIYASGFRNPAYATFDSAGSHRMFIANAGQRLFESVFILYKGGAYPWNFRDGTHCFDTADNTRPGSGPCPVTAADGRPLVGPVAEIGHDLGNTVVGGVLYRGSSIPALQGSYVYGMWTTGSQAGGDGNLLVSTPPGGLNLSALPGEAAALTPAQNAMWTTRLISVATAGSGRVQAYVRGLFENNEHEILVLTNHAAGPEAEAQGTGEVWLVVPPQMPEMATTPTGTASVDVTTPQPAAPVGNEVSLTLTARDRGFDRTSLSAPAGSPVVLTFVNEETTLHNVALYTDSSAQTELFAGSPVRGPSTAVYRFTAPSVPGTYFFRCDFHPVTMSGTFVAT